MEGGPGAGSSPEEAWDSGRMEDVVRALGCFLLFGLAGSPPPCAFSPFAMTHHSSPGGGLQRKVIYSRPLPFPPIWPRAWPRVGSALGAPSRRPLAWLPPRWCPGSGRPCPSPVSLLTAPGHPARQADRRGSGPPHLLLGGLGPSDTSRAVPLPPRGGCEGSEGSPCEEASRQCSVNISPTVIGGSAAARTQE